MAIIISPDKPLGKVKFRISIIAGVIAGLLTIMLFWALYAYDPSIMLSMTTYWGSLIIYILAMLMVILRTKSVQKGILPYRQGLQLGFVTFLVANLIFFVFYYWLFSMDEGLIDIQLQQVQDFAETLPDDSWGREKLEEPGREELKITLPNTIFRYARGAIGGFFIAAFLAVLAKQEK